MKTVMLWMKAGSARNALINRLTPVKAVRPGLSMSPWHALTLLLLAFAATPAFAHTGLHIGSGLGGGFGSGVAHPFLGLDHLLAMLMVGLWAAQQDRPWQRMLPPVVFVGVMALGGLLAQSTGQTGFVLPQVENGIAVSVLGLGLLTAFAIRLPALLMLPVIAGFALFHGYAHGAEMPVVTMWTYMVGFVLATASLHAMGYFSARALLEKQGRMVQAAGALGAVSGGLMLLG